MSSDCAHWPLPSPQTLLLHRGKKHSMRGEGRGERGERVSLTSSDGMLQDKGQAVDAVLRLLVVCAGTCFHLEPTMTQEDATRQAHRLLGVFGSLAACAQQQQQQSPTGYSLTPPHGQLAGHFSALNGELLCAN